MPSIRCWCGATAELADRALRILTPRRLARAVQCPHCLRLLVLDPGDNVVGLFQPDRADGPGYDFFATD